MDEEAERPETRRRAPYWVRAFSDTALHGLAGKLCREEQHGDPSERQVWLLDVAMNELEYRARRDRRHGITPCACRFCCEPFPEVAP